ncbi:MAG TPA: PKD domain-containing protein, partial [Planctomycetes bacterium]|nr:PKD domain-containing protein [Planctomycetota bacterium]
MNPWKIHALALLILFTSGCGGGSGGDASGPPPPPPPAAPTANFSIDVTSGVAPVTVDFTDASTGNISSYTWNFGDGESSTSQNPSHTYSAAGIYDVSLMVTGPGGSDTSPCTDCITVFLYPPLSDVRDAQPGTERTVEAIISVEPGTFESSTGEVGFALQDVTSGVYVQVSSALGLDLSGFSLGDRVRVTGVVGDLDQLVTLTIDELADILPVSGGFIFFPSALDTAQIDDTVNNPEGEANIVGLDGVIVVDPGGSGETVVRDEDPGVDEIPGNDGPDGIPGTADDVATIPAVEGQLFGWKIWLDDGSGVAQTFWHPTANMDPEALTFITAGAPMRINGFLNRHIDQYEVFPRGDFDVSIPIATARSLADGEKVLVRGLIGLNPASLEYEGDFGFSLHEDNGDGTQDGIFVSITSNATVIGNYAGNPMPLDDLIAAVDLGNRKVHVSGILETTVGGDRILAVGDGDVRLLSEALGSPFTLQLATGAVSANLGRWVTASGTLQTPPAGSSGPFSGWTLGPGGFQARINGGSGPVNVLLPFGAMGDLTGDGVIDFSDFSTSLSTPIINPFHVAVGGNLQVVGFARNHD